MSEVQIYKAQEEDHVKLRKLDQHTPPGHQNSTISNCSNAHSLQEAFQIVTPIHQER